MNNWSYLIISIFIGSIIGYLTNAIAIYMLFHPKKKFLGFTGVIPKRKDRLAESIAENIHIALPKEYEKIKSIPLIGKGIDTVIKFSVSKNIKKVSSEEIEKTIKKIAKKEFLLIEIIGGVLGGLIGLIQGIIFLYIS